ncbi:MAG: hypothetical protein HYV26_02915, partial [Candidatus Hydrogenedentes bacterium]|nr:hypothetical protein [Candidatus Hydrogenedentota bacterium]
DYTHDLDELVQQLKDIGEDVQGLSRLIEFTVFGIQYRYAHYPKDLERPDRSQILSEVEAFVARVALMLG